MCLSNENRWGNMEIGERRPRNLSATRRCFNGRKSERYMRRSLSCDELALCRNRAKSPVVRAMSPLVKEKRTLKLASSNQYCDGKDLKRRTKRRTRSQRCSSMNTSKKNENLQNKKLFQCNMINSDSENCNLQRIECEKKKSITKLISFPTNSLLHSAVTEGDIELAQRLLLDDPTAVNKFGLEGTAPIHEAAINGDLNSMELLIKYGASLEIKDKYNRTPLEYTVLAGHFDCASLLLSFGASDESIRDGVPCL